MSEIMHTRPVALPAPKTPMRVRVAMADLPFIDQCQKKHSKALGFFPRMQMIEYLEAGNVLIARELRDRWMEHVSASPTGPLMGKYDIHRQIAQPALRLRLGAVAA